MRRLIIELLEGQCGCHVVLDGQLTPAADAIVVDEFFRLFNHYRFRQRLNLTPVDATPGPETGTEADIGLIEDDTWWPKYYDESARDKQRRILAGS